MEKNKKEVTLQDIVELINESKKETIGLINETRNALEKKVDSVEESLAVSMQRQFLAEREYMDKRFDGVDRKFASIDKRFDGMDRRFDETDEKLEDIKADIHKKVGKIEHNDLTYRVEKLEKKMKLVTV